MHYSSLLFLSNSKICQPKRRICQPRIPTILVLLCGTIKCSERIRALYYGSANSFRSSILSIPDLDAYKIRMNKDALSSLQVMQCSFEYFMAFKGLVGLALRVHERSQSRDFFLATSYKDAFRLVEVELNYIYDALFTKLSVLQHKFGYCSRTLSFIAVVASLALFHFDLNREDMFHPDTVITYILLIGAIVLDLLQFFMLLFCDWTIVKLSSLFDANAKHKSWKHKFVDWLLFVKTTTNSFLDWLFGIGRDRVHHCAPKFANSRWAEYLSTFNLIHYCLHKRSKGKEKNYNYFGVVSLLNEIWYVKPLPLSYYIIDFIFNEMKMKSQKADSLAMAKQICSSKGEWVLHEIEGLDIFLPYLANYNYDDILLLWHIATEVCYNDCQDQLTNNLEQRDTAKKLLDYMLYLMVMKADMMSAVSSTGDIKFLDTCIEVSKLFDTKLSELKKEKCCFFGRESKKEEEALHVKACETILSINSEVKPVPVLG